MPTKLLFGLALLAAFAARVVVAFVSETILHPDEVFQNLEQAHLMVFNYGVMPWEYFAGLRSYLIPGFIAGILLLLKTLGLGTPDIYIPVVKVVFCLLSMTVPIGMAAIGRIFFNKRIALIGFLFGCFFQEFIVFGHKALPTLTATYILMASFVPLYFLHRKANEANDDDLRHPLLLIWLFSGLVVLTAALRIQLFFVCLSLLGLVFLNLGKQDHHKALRTHLFVSAALWTLLVGLFDAVTWKDVPWFSYFQNVRLNFFEDYATLFGVEPWNWYFKKVFFSYYGLFGIGLLVALLRRQWFLPGVIVLGVLVPHSMILHKEARFIFVLYPFFLILLAYALNLGLDWATNKITNPEPTEPKKTAHPIAVFLVLLVVARPLFLPAPIIFGENRRDTINSIYDMFKYLREDDSVQGVGFDSFYFNSLGYYYLHKKVPFYTPVFVAVEGQMKPGTELHSILNNSFQGYGASHYMSHIVTQNPEIEHYGFEMTKQIGEWFIWKAKEPIRWTWDHFTIGFYCPKLVYGFNKEKSKKGGIDWINLVPVPVDSNDPEPK